MRNYIFYYFIVILLIGCRKDFDISTYSVSSPFPKENVESNLRGIVTSEDGQPISQATIVVAGQTITTNRQGFFIVKKKLMDKYGQWVKASKGGYFTSGQFGFQTLGNSSFVHIRFIKKEQAQIFNSATGGTISANTSNPDLSKITFPANSIYYVNNGKRYDGPVHVYIKALQADSLNFVDRMPGDFRGKDKLGNAKILSSYGMLALEIAGPLGEPLKMGDGQKAKISIQIPSTLQSNAPSQLPLYFLDEKTGIWIENGIAVQQNKSFTSEITNFGFINFATPDNYVFIEGGVSYTNGTPAENALVQLKSSQFNYKSIYSDRSGRFFGIIPAQQLMQMTILAPNNCSMMSNIKQSIGPFSQDVDLGKLTFPSGSPLTLHGTLVGCTNLPISNAIITVYLGGVNYLTSMFTGSDGTFSVILPECYKDSYVGLTAYISNNYLINGFKVVGLTKFDVNADTILICDEIKSYFRVNYDGEKYFSSGAIWDINPTLYEIYWAESLPLKGFCEIFFDQFDQNLSLSGKLYYLGISFKGKNNEYKTGKCIDFCNTCDCKPTEIYFSRFDEGAGTCIGGLAGMVHDTVLETYVPYNIEFKFEK